MIYVLKIIWDYRVPPLELIVRNIARYPQSATSMSIRYQPAIRYLLPCCHNMKGEKDMCVVGGVNNYTAVLMNSSAPSKHASDDTSLYHMCLFITL
jgi:hypothetical protein